jgi:hypothetical protein
VAQVQGDGVTVFFACKCMTHDQTESKFWYNGEYEQLDRATVSAKLDQHDIHCPFFTDVEEIMTKDVSTT